MRNICFVINERFGKHMGHSINNGLKDRSWNKIINRTFTDLATIEVEIGISGIIKEKKIFKEFLDLYFETV